MQHLLVVDDDLELLASVSECLAQTGNFRISRAANGRDALAIVLSEAVDILVLDVDMPGMSGLEVLEQVKARHPATVVMIMTAYATIDDAVLAVKKGAYHYLPKPIDTDKLLNLIERALAAHAMVSALAASAPTMAAGRPIVGETAPMQRIFALIHRLAKVDTPVLVRGPSGTGKELVARAIHSNSISKDGPFVAVNCSAIPENLFESELFGHEKGAFTGADQRKIGKFQYAEGGTLFLDEIGDMPVMLQAKLLRVLQEKVFTPVGANREIEAKVRVIAATNRPLEQMIAVGAFREDLYYRLNVMPITLPALADRRADLPHLIRLFIDKFNSKHARKIRGISPLAEAALMQHSWPGNIRELENLIEHAFIMEDSDTLQLNSFPAEITLGLDQQNHAEPPPAQLKNWHQSPPTPTHRHTQVAETTIQNNESRPVNEATAPPSAETAEPGPPVNGDWDFNQEREQFERDFILRALKNFKGRINQTALHANIPKKTLLRKLEKYGINARDFTD